MEISNGATRMARIAQEHDQQLADQQLAELEGWGKLKKKLGLNKLQTRKALKSVNKAVVAVVAPTKKNRAKAEDDLKPHVGKILAAGDLLVPGAGTAASLAWTKNRMDSAKKKIKAQIAANKMAARASESPVSVPTADAVQSGGGGAAISYAAPSESTASGVSVETAEPAPAPAEEKKTNWLAVGGGTLLAVKALSMVI